MKPAELQDGRNAQEKMAQVSFSEMLQRVVGGQNLSEEEAAAIMDTIMTGQATSAQIGAFLVALRMKGESIEEITGFARVMREKATTIASKKPLLIDTCGTGGDGANTFNISTTAAFVVAGAGLPVAKHGNRSVSSKSGSADVLEALGININLTPEQVARCIDEVGIGFLYAPALHGAMKHAIGPRRELGMRTVFNILGPLTNPAGAQAQVLGVFNPDLTEPLAYVLQRLGAKNAFVVHGSGNIDEVGISGPNKITALRNGEVSTFYLEPEMVGLQRAPLSAIRGGDAGENAEITLKVLRGEAGPCLDITLLNAALALVAGEAAGTIREGLALAEETVRSGKALAKLEQLIEASKKYGAE